MVYSIWMFILTSLYSAGIGILVGILCIQPFNQGNTLANVLAVSAGIGVIIGTLSKLAGILAFRYASRGLFVSYCAVFVVAGLLTLAFAGPVSFLQRVLQVVIVEPLAMLGMFLTIRYGHRLNDSLKRKQTVVSQNLALKQAQTRQNPDEPQR